MVDGVACFIAGGTDTGVVAVGCGTGEVVATGDRFNSVHDPEGKGKVGDELHPNSSAADSIPLEVSLRFMWVTKMV